MNLIVAIASICTIAGSILPILNKILPFGSSNSKEKKLLEEIDLYNKTKEFFKESNPSANPHLAQRGTRAQYRDESILRANRDRLRESMVIQSALKEYPRANMFLPVSMAILSCILLICFSILTSPLLLSANSFYTLPLLYPNIVCSILLGIICFSLGLLGERQMCFDDYAEQLRKKSFPLIPRQPRDGVHFNGMGSCHRFFISWLGYSVIYVVVFLCVFLPFAISVSDTSSNSIDLEAGFRLVLVSFLVVCLAGSALVTGFLRWFYVKDFQKNTGDQTAGS